jgi:BirA family biotin operon repressor/biotin-[acetyl-CoA-carboxylase] ligase
VTDHLGSPRIHVRQIDSTNLRARLLAASGAPGGTLVTAGEQTAGRGRQGRGWASPPGTSLSMSLVLRDPPRLASLAAGVAVAETIDTALGTDTSLVPATDPPFALIKWPNDVLISGRKVAGVLVEGRPRGRWGVLGIGVTVAVPSQAFPEEIRQRAGTLNLSKSAIEPTLHVLLAALERWLTASEAEVLSAVRARDVLLGAPVSWSGGTGIGAGIDVDGHLRVTLAGGRQLALEAGEVHLQPSPAAGG